MKPTERVLVIFAHPALRKSKVNVHLASALRSLPAVTFHDLYEHYPDFDIDVAKEQALLLEHTHIVLQHPFYWYSGPALLKEWLDLVFEHGFAYGPGGDKLRGKTLLSAITTGGTEDAYSRTGHNRFTIRELLVPFEQTARLCEMTWLPPFVVYSALNLQSKADVAPYAEDLTRLLGLLRDGRIDPKKISGLPRLNRFSA